MHVTEMSYIQAVPPFSGGAAQAWGIAYPIQHYERIAVTRRTEYVFVARCKNCHREFHLDPDVPIAPAYCGLGMTHGCGSSEWHVFKRLIEVEAEDEYVDNCIYSSDTLATPRPVGSCQVGKYYAEPEIGCLTLPRMTRKEVSAFRKKWEQVIRHIRQNSCTPWWHVA